MLALALFGFVAFSFGAGLLLNALVLVPVFGLSLVWRTVIGGLFGLALGLIGSIAWLSWSSR